MVQTTVSLLCFNSKSKENNLQDLDMSLTAIPFESDSYPSPYVDKELLKSMF